MSAYAGVRALVLGASGFVGRHVAMALDQAGARLSLAVRDPAAARAVLPGLRAEVVVVDATRPATVADGVARLAPAIVFNLIGYGVDPTERDAALATAINADLPPLLAEAMKTSRDPSWRGQHVVHVGSALEYGTAAGDLDEQTVCTPTTLYGRTKLEGTLRLAEAAHRLGVRAVTARLFTVYGPGELAGRLLPSLLAARHTQDPIPLSAGQQHRDFTYVTDAVASLLQLGALDRADLGIVNVATGRLTTVRGFVESAAEVLAIAAPRLRFGALPTRPEEMRHDPVSTRRLSKLTGDVPAVSIRDGVARTAALRQERGQLP